MWIANLEYNILSNNFFLVMFDALICFWIFFVPFTWYSLKLYFSIYQTHDMVHIIWTMLYNMGWTIWKTEVQYDKLKLCWVFTDTNGVLSCYIVDCTSNQGRWGFSWSITVIIVLKLKGCWTGHTIAKL